MRKNPNISSNTKNRDPILTCCRSIQILSIIALGAFASTAWAQTEIPDWVIDDFNWSSTGRIAAANGGNETIRYSNSTGWGWGGFTPGTAALGAESGSLNMQDS